MKALVRTALLLGALVTASPAWARELPHVHGDGVWDVEYSPNGQLVATAGGDGVVRIWDTQSLKEVSHFTQSTQGFQVYDVHFLPDGERIAATALAGKPAVWDVRTGQLIKVLEGHEENVVRLAHSRDGSLLYTAGSDDYVFAWDLRTLEIVGRYHVKSPVGIVPLDATGKILVVAQGGVYVADVLAGTTAMTWTESPYYFAAADAGRFALVGGSIGENALPVLIDPRTGQNSTAFLGFDSGFIWNLAASAESSLAAASLYQGRAMAWNFANGKIVYDSANEAWQSLAVGFSPDGHELAVGDTEGTVRFIPVR